jgi:[acyl-carrier-protein] S-malonyltransferase
MNSAVLFQGQGSYITAYFKKLIADSNILNPYIDAAGDILGWSPLEVINNNDNIGHLNTDVAQPLIFLMEYLGWIAYKDSLPEMPEFFLGHSLGEITALTASGVFEYEQALNLVKKRGLLMQSVGTDDKQGMMAVFGLSAEKAEELCKRATEKSGKYVYCANYNGKGNIVISGATEALSYIAEYESIKFKPLQVTRAFHTAFMKSVADEFHKILEEEKMKPFVYPVVANVTGRPYQSTWTIVGLLSRHICSPVRWYDSIEYLKKRGIDAFLQVSDSRMFQIMDGLSESSYVWGDVGSYAERRYYDYNLMYPASKTKAVYRPEIIGEILSSMIADPWPINTSQVDIEEATKLYNISRTYLNTDLFAYQDLMQAVDRLKKIMIKKKIDATSIKNRIDYILLKYGIDVDHN